MAEWRLYISLASVCALLGLAGCASTPMPDAEMARASASVAQARQSGAGEAAPMELRSAEDNLRNARSAVTSKKADRARALAEKAELDAELAQAKLRRQQAERAAAEVQAATDSLRQESERSMNTSPANSSPAREAP
ncbi:MAG: DUF4398 domain-containing protein [Gammaproteobacteria bacterium]